MTFLEALCVGMSGYLAFYAVRSGTCAVPSIAARAIPAAILQFVTAGVLGTAHGGWPAMVARAPPSLPWLSSRRAQARSSALGSPPGLR